MRPGFIPALGTPLDRDGHLLEASYKKQICDMIDRGAVGVLSMGSMGIQAMLRTETAVRTARVAVEAAAGRVPVFVGAMDCSIARVKDRMAAMEELDVAAFVLTVPYYSKTNPAQAVNFFKGVAAATRHGLVLYDLPGVTQFKATYGLLKTLLAEVPSLKGIKTADLALLRSLRLDPAVPDDFVMACSNLDLFDSACQSGVTNCLDGMLPVTPANTQALFRAVAAGDWTEAAKRLDNIVALRDFFAGHDLWPSFTCGMNLLGYEGDFHPDYVSPLKDGYADAIRAEMTRIGEPVLG